TVPWEIAGRFTTNIIVENNGVQSAPINLGLIDVAPGIYTRDSTGLHQAVALNQDNTINGTTPDASPAGQGQAVVLYATGCGVTDPPGVTGSVSPSDQLLWIRGPVSLTVGAQNAQVLFTGASPADVTGICQISVQLPVGVTGTSLPVLLSINGV